MQESQLPETPPAGSNRWVADGAEPGLGLEDIEEFPMREGDLDDVVALEQIAFRDPWSRMSFQAEITTSAVSWCRVLRARGRLLGYMVAWFVEDEAHLANIAVAPAFRRRGLAQRMLDLLYREAYLRGTRIVVLEVRASNEGAITLYERNGFVPGGIRKSYYNHPREDAIVMVRSMRSPEEEEA